jgi:hypothetical protein
VEESETSINKHYFFTFLFGPKRVEGNGCKLLLQASPTRVCKRYSIPPYKRSPCKGRILPLLIGGYTVGTEREGGHQAFPIDLLRLVADAGSGIAAPLHSGPLAHLLFGSLQSFQAAKILYLRLGRLRQQLVLREQALLLACATLFLGAYLHHIRRFHYSPCSGDFSAAPAQEVSVQSLLRRFRCIFCKGGFSAASAQEISVQNLHRRFQCIPYSGAFSGKPTQEISVQPLLISFSEQTFLDALLCP